jgi:hypothetical protein
MPREGDGGRAVSSAELRRALAIAAQLVERHGEAALPIFLRLETELAEREAEGDALARALSLARRAA